MMHPKKIQLCVVLVDWTVESTKELRLGEATGGGVKKTLEVWIKQNVALRLELELEITFRFFYSNIF